MALDLLRDRWNTEIQCGDDAEKIEAAQGLLSLGEYGDPVGAYALAGGRAAFRLGRLADAAVLLYHGLRVAQPGTMMWAELLVHRAIVCAHHGFWIDAIDAGRTFLDNLSNLAPEAVKWEPFVHHAVGFSLAHLERYAEAVPYHRYALDLYADPVRRATAANDLAYALALSGNPGDAYQVISRIDPGQLSGKLVFIYWSTVAVIRHSLGQFTESLAAAERAFSAAIGNEERWATLLAELNYWRSRAAWGAGDRYHSAAWALRAAIAADQRGHITLRDTANAWLEEIMKQGGITGA